jgi:hypothetical protein
MGLGEGEFASAAADDEFHKADFRDDVLLGNTLEYRKSAVGSKRTGMGAKNAVMGPIWPSFGGVTYVG